MSDSTISKATVYIFIGLMILTGSINTIANKMQINLESLGKPYQHVWFITFCMFIGESTCLIWYAIHLMNQTRKEPLLENSSQSGKEEQKEAKKEASPFILAIPALADFFGSTIMTFGLTMLTGSVYQMFRGSLILFTALFSIVFLGRKLFRHHFLAITITVSGLLIVGLATLIWPASTPEGCSSGKGVDNSIGGIALVLVSQIFTASQFVIEEKIFSSYSCHPLKVVGWEGIWGSILYAILLSVFQFIPCTPPPEEGTNISYFICSPNDKGEWTLEDTVFAFRQMGNNGILLFYVILYTCSIALFNFVGISVTKFLSSPARAVIDTVRTVVVWFFFLMPFINKCYRESFNYMQLIGFILLVAGTVIYNEVIVLPFCGLNKYVKKTEKQDKTLDDEENNQISMDTSPILGKTEDE
jgi:drug/metabolite transporter (DMT)-like permease